VTVALQDTLLEAKVQKTPPRYGSSETAALTPAAIKKHAQGWLLDCEIRQHSKRTLDRRREMLDKFLWWLHQEEVAEVGTFELRMFFAYLTRGHQDAGGRWGNPQLSSALRPRTVKDYHGHLRTFFRWLISEEVIETSPMEKLAAPVARADQIQPFTEEQVRSLIASTKHTHHPKRDRAILMFMLDTGARASEVCGLKVRDVDLQNRCAQVLGKGNKHRQIFFSGQTTKDLYNYLCEKEKESHEALFTSDRGTRAGDGLTRSGLLQLFERLGAASGIEVTRCSPHTMRHTAAIMFLRSGGNQFSLMQMLGHNQVQMTARYVALAQGDVRQQHRQHSPVEMLKGRGRL
jgi:site-specific recombinase XerD